MVCATLQDYNFQGNFISTIVVQCRLSFLSHPRTSDKSNITNQKFEDRTTSNKKIKRNGKGSYEIHETNQWQQIQKMMNQIEHIESTNRFSINTFNWKEMIK